MLRQLAHHDSITLSAQVPAVTLAVVQEVKMKLYIIIYFYSCVVLRLELPKINTE